MRYVLLIGFVILLVGIYLGFCWYVASQVVASYNGPLTSPASSIAPTHEDIAVTTQDDVTLKGWLFRGTTDRLVVLVAGIGNNRINSDYHGVDLAKELLAKGYGVLVYDARGEGESIAPHVTYGVKEGPDLIAIINYAKSKGYTPEHMAIIADSLGAISTLMVFDQLTDIGAIVLDSPAAHMKPVVANIMKRDHKIPTFLHPTVFFFTKYVYGVDFDNIHPVDKLKQVHKKFILPWGDQDYVMTRDQIDEILAASPQSQLVVFAGGGHVATYKLDPALYREKIFGFIDQEINQP